MITQRHSYRAPSGPLWRVEYRDPAGEVQTTCMFAADEESVRSVFARHFSHCQVVSVTKTEEEKHQ